MGSSQRMRRPIWHPAMFAAVSGVLGLAMLAGCATRQSGLNASDEASRYLQSARGRYTIPGPPSDPWGPYIREASHRFDMPETWIRALMRQESGGSLYRNGRLITSSAGAMGLMQVMPGTYRELRARHNLGPDPFEPHDNIMAGVGYMREMYDIYGAPGFLAAYNAGPNRLDDYLANQRSMPDETRKYVAAIGPSLRYAQPKVRSPAEQYALNQIPLRIPPGPRFGYGTAPSIQLAAAQTTQPVYQPPPVRVAIQPPPPVYSQPAPQPRAVAWAEPPRPVYTPPPRQTVAANAREPAHAVYPVKMALAAPHRSGGMHLISGAMAAESVPVRKAGKTAAVPVNYGRSDRIHTPAAKAPVGKLHATGTARGCHKDTKGKMVCGPGHL